MGKPRPIFSIRDPQLSHEILRIYEELYKILSGIKAIKTKLEDLERRVTALE